MGSMLAWVWIRARTRTGAQPADLAFQCVRTGLWRGCMQRPADEIPEMSRTVVRNVETPYCGGRVEASTRGWMALTMTTYRSSAVLGLRRLGGSCPSARVQWVEWLRRER